MFGVLQSDTSLYQDCTASVPVGTSEEPYRFSPSGPIEALQESLC
ncbi:hypothetical protein [uncultured Sphaerotilus sp.]